MKERFRVSVIESDYNKFLETRKPYYRPSINNNIKFIEANPLEHNYKNDKKIKMY